MRRGSHILDHLNDQSVGGQGPDGGFPSQANPPHEDVDALQADRLGSLYHVADNDAGGVGRGFLRTPKPALAGRRPTDDVPLLVGQGDDGVIIGGVNVRLAVLYELLFLRRARFHRRRRGCWRRRFGWQRRGGRGSSRLFQFVNHRVTLSLFRGGFAARPHRFADIAADGAGIRSRALTAGR